MNKEITTRPQKVLLVITKSNWGGAQKYVYDIATSLHKQYFDVAVAVGGNGELAARLKESGVRVIELRKLKNNMNPFTSFLSFLELLTLYRKERPHVVHLNSSKVGLFGAIAARIALVPTIVFTAHGWTFNEERAVWQKIMLRTLAYITVLCSNRTICVSKKTLTALHAPAFLKKKCIIVHNGIAPISFKSPTAFYEEKHCMRREKTTLVSVGELHPSKGFDLALSYLKDAQDLSWEWFILGEGHARAALEALIKKYDLSSRVHLMGHTRNAAQYLNSFDLFFLPSRTEALAYVALEALQSDLPIIASDVGGIPEVLARDPGAILVNIKKEDTLLTLRKILSSYPQKVTSGRETLREEFSLARMIEKTVEVYRELL